MAQLIITIPDNQVDRVREAFGQNPLSYPPQPPVLATAEEVRAAIISFLKGRTIEYEREKARLEAYSALPVDLPIT